jgi:hypothetical protein
MLLGGTTTYHRRDQQVDPVPPALPEAGERECREFQNNLKFRIDFFLNIIYLLFCIKYLNG